MDMTQLLAGLALERPGLGGHEAMVLWQIAQGNDLNNPDAVAFVASYWEDKEV